MLEKTDKIPLVIELAGGLGNQLFQYVFGKLLLQKLRIQGRGSYILYYDVSAVLRDTKRKFLLSKCLNETDDVFIKSRKDLFKILGERVGTSLSKTEKLIDLVKPYTKGEMSDENASYILIHEKNFKNFKNDELAHFVALSIADDKKAVFVRGYWQRGTSILAYLKQHSYTFGLSKKSTAYQIMYKKILEKNSSVSIHIRRSDYLDPSTSKSYPPSSIEYYVEAVKIHLKKYPDAHFFLFSDDVIWLKKNFISIILHHLKKIPLTVVSTGSKKIFEINTIISDYEELFLMNQCVHHILANSSFSWWGSGMLSIDQVRRGIVIAPHVWHIDMQKTAQILLPKWTIIDK